MKATLITLIILANIKIFGQINVGPIEFVKFKNTGEFEQVDLNKLKRTKTIFVYKECDKENLNSFKSTLKGAWSFTELEFISYEEFSSNRYDDNYSFFTIGGFHNLYISNNGVKTEITHTYLTLWMNKAKEKLTFCRIELHPTFPTYQKANELSSGYSDIMISYLYNESIILNWNLVYLKNALQFVAMKLSKSEEHPIYQSKIYSDLSCLEKDTLFIPEYTLIKLSGFTGDESKRHNLKKLLKKYPYPYKLVTIKELEEKTSNSTRPVYYLSYIRSTTDKFISVFNAQSGEMLYSEYKPISYNIKDKDLGKLANKIKKNK